MATRRIKEITNTATTFASDDFIALDGTSQGTRKMDKDDLISEVSAGVSGDYLEEANNLSDVASLDTSKLNLEVPDVGTAPNEVPLNGMLGSLAYQSADSVSMGTVEADSLEVDGETKSGSLNVYDANGNASNSLDLTYNGSSGVANIQADSNGGNTSLTLGTSNAGSVATRMTIDSSGNVTVASGDVTATTGQFNSGASNASGPGFAVSAGNGIYNSGANQIGFSTNSTQRAVIDSSGRLGVNQTSPGSYNAAADDLVVGDGSGDRGLTISSGNASQGGLYFADGTTGSDQYAGGLIYYHNLNRLDFYTAGGAQWFLGSTGNLIAASAGNGIDFGSGSTLSDYEEGEHTTTVTPGVSGSITLLTSEDKFSYTKIGRSIIVTGILKVDSVSSPTGPSMYFSLPTSTLDLGDISGGFGTSASFYDNSSGAWSVVPCSTGESTSNLFVNMDASTVEANDQFRIMVCYQSA